MRRLAIHLCFALFSFAQAPTLLEQADEAFRAGDIDRAAKLARQVLAREPRVVHAHMIAGIAAATKKQWVASDRHFRAVIRLEPSNPYGYFYLGQARLYQQQWEPAIRFFSKAIDLRYPDRERLTVEMALAQNEAGRPQEALKSLAAIEPPGDPRLAAQFHAVMAFSQANLNMPGPAVEAMRRALHLDDSIADSWEFLIGALLNMKEAPQALAEAIRAQRKFPDHPIIQYMFALASYQVTESPLSRVALRNLREADPTSPRVLLAEGLLHRKEGRTAEATSAFVQAARRGLPDARLLLGIVYSENGDIALAKREFREAERLDPRNGQVALELGRLLLSRGQLEEARLRLEKAVLAMPDFPAAHYQLGLLYRKLDQAEKADTHFKRYRELSGGTR